MSNAAKSHLCYVPRSPQKTPCYKIVNENLDTFIGNRQYEGRPLPKFVVDEFEAFLRCGIPAFGFLRLKCCSCDNEKITAFSCKKRGFCPSCCAKRKAEAAAHLVDNILPLVPYRQFVITFPIPMRYWLQTNKKLYSKIHGIVIQCIHQFYEARGHDLGIDSPKPGTISFTQRWGSALNLNPHMHVLAIDGIYHLPKGKDDPLFRNVETITDEDVADLLVNISKRVRKFLTKKGYLDTCGDVVENPLADPLFADSEALSLATDCSLKGKIAFGPNAGKFVTRIGRGFGFLEEIPLAKGKLCFSIHGFSLHAKTSVNTHRRDQLEKLVEYMARGPLSNERLEITSEGNVKLELKRKFSDGTTHFLFTPEEFVEKLCALIPPPRTHMTRWAGVFAPASPLRSKVILNPGTKKGFDFQSDETTKNSTWAKMLARVFGIDVLQCELCEERLVPVAAVTDPFQVRRYLRHIGTDPDPPSRGPPSGLVYQQLIH